MNIGKAVGVLREDGFAAFAVRVKNHLARRLKGKHSAVTVSHGDAIEWFEQQRDGYEKLIAAVTPHVDSQGTIFDIGANIGYFTHLLAESLQFKGSAFLFEPVTHLADLCKATFRDAPFEVTVLDYGLSDNDAEEDIFIAGNGNLGWNTLVSQKSTPDMSKNRIRLRRFDGCGIAVTPSFIKVDVEGAEYRVFRGMLGSFRKWHRLPVVLCEIGFGHSHPAWKEELAVFAEMRRMGYTICDIDGAPIDESSLQSTTDVLLIPDKVS